MLTWYDWLVLPGSALKRHGVDPALRSINTGHNRPLPRKWARTIGYWGRADPADIMAVVGIDPKSVKERNSYESFKSRQSLTSARNIAEFRKVSIDVWRQISSMVLATDSSYLIGQHLDKNPGDLVNAWRHASDSLGILPVEAMLYDAEFSRVLSAIGLQEQEFHDLEVDKRVKHWDNTEAGISAPDTARFQVRAVPRYNR